MVTISDSDSTILIRESATNSFNITKSLIQLEAIGVDVFIRWGNRYKQYAFTQVASPASISAEDLKSKIEAFLDSGGGGLSNVSITKIPIKEFASEQLTLPGQKTTAQDASDFNKGTFEYQISNIDTDLTVRFEGTLQDNPTDSDFYNLDVNEEDTTKTANGTFAAKFSGRHKKVRMNFISRTGVAFAPVIDVKLILGN